MKKIDYTKIRNKKIRSKICKLMSEMLDNPDEHGIYPTSKFMWKMETYILGIIEKTKKEEYLFEQKLRKVYNKSSE
jgi:hypothetical protein